LPRAPHLPGSAESDGLFASPDGRGHFMPSAFFTQAITMSGRRQSPTARTTWVRMLDARRNALQRSLWPYSPIRLLHARQMTARFTTVPIPRISGRRPLTRHQGSAWQLPRLLATTKRTLLPAASSQIPWKSNASWCAAYLPS